MHFVAAGRELQRQTGAALFIFGGSATAEVDACRRLADALAPAAVNLAGRTSLLEMGSWLHAMDLVIANDSGPMHMAAALGIPVLALFGPTDARRTGPYGPRHRVLNAGTECAPCFQRACRLAGDSCMTRIHPVAVVEAAVQMLRASR
jgi:ADP-heptose:LPS heptosyltransferase